MVARTTDGKVNPRRRRDFAGDDRQAGGDERLARDARGRVFGDDRIEHRVRNRVSDLVGMAFGDGFGREQVGLRHRQWDVVELWLGDWRNVRCSASTRTKLLRSLPIPSAATRHSPTPQQAGNAARVPRQAPFAQRVPRSRLPPPGPC